MYTVFISILFVLFGSMASAEGRSVRFTEDPLVLPGNGYHALIEIGGMSIYEDECLVGVSYPDGEMPIFSDESGPFQLISLDGKYTLTLMQVFATAQEICWPSS